MIDSCKIIFHECFKLFIRQVFSLLSLYLPSQVNDLTGSKKHDDATNRIKPMELPRIRGTLPDLFPPFNLRRDHPMADENEKD